MLNEKLFFAAAIIFYGLSSFSYLILFILKRLEFSNYGNWLVKAGFLFHTIALILRTIEAGRLPLTNQYEFASSFAWGIALTFIIVEWKYKFKTLGLFATPFM